MECIYFGKPDTEIPDWFAQKCENCKDAGKCYDKAQEA